MTDSSKPKQKALCVATRCATVEQFIATFHRFCDDSTFFVATLATRPVGLDTAFSIQLEDKTPVLRGLCSVVEAWATPANRFGRPGVRLAVKRLTNESILVFRQLQIARKAAEAAEAAGVVAAPVASGAIHIVDTVPPLTVPIATATIPASPDTAAAFATLKLIALAPRRVEPKRVEETGESTTPTARLPPKLPPLRPMSPLPRQPVKAMTPALPDSPPPHDYVPEPIAASDDLTTPVATETRTPGSSYVLPANPLMNLTDKSLEGFIDCALYEETGNFFRAPEYEDSLVDIDDVLATPPAPARPAPRTLSPLAALRPNAFVPVEPNQDFSPEVTPLPYLAGIVPHRAETEPPIPSTPHAGRAPTPPVFDEGSDMFHGHGYEPTSVGTRPPPTAPPPNMPMAMQPMAMQPMAAAPQAPHALAGHAPMAHRKRWLLIGGVAAGTSLLLLIIAIATSGGRRNTSADAATPPAKDPVAAQPPATTTTRAPAIAKPPAPANAPEAKAPQPPPEESAEEPGGDPNAPPVVGNGPCRITVNSSPAGSMVSVDDQQIGPSPITIAGPCAKRKVDVQHPRYALGTRWVSLAAGKPANVDLALGRPTHTVTVTSTPSGATVSIAGRRAGTTPTQVKVMGFTGVTLTVEKKGFKTATQKLYSKVDGERLGVVLVRGK